jgi:hypothetical protein
MFSLAQVFTPVGENEFGFQPLKGQIALARNKTQP